LNLKSTVNLFKLMGKVLYATADIAMGMHNANATEQIGRIAYPYGFSEEHWR